MTSHQYAQQAVEVVRKARGLLGVNQADFAKLLGSTQPLVSKYEAGKVAPPSHLLMHCIHIIEKSSRAAGRREAAPASDAQSTTKEGWTGVRKALKDLVSAIEAVQARD
jgi:transcriptional regulator with XRE-family HTH domain